MLRINAGRSGYKKVLRYFQITKHEFKYFNSIFSSSVWHDKPLYRVKIENIKNVKISNDDMVRFKFEDVNFVIDIVDANDKFLQFGWEDSEEGLSVIRIILLLKQFYKVK